MINLKPFIEQAKSFSPWDFSNKILYDLCSFHPSHKDVSTVLAKILLIGRTYAAAIERRRSKVEDNDDFYVDKVAPIIINSEIDTWINSLAKFDIPNEKSLENIQMVHLNVTKLFSEISGLDKRSLASKYLHFHNPNLFYIYDSRAVSSIRKFTSIIGSVTNKAISADKEYFIFSTKCNRLQNYFLSEYGVLLTPRELDNFLLRTESIII